jgi:hypothetical protein
VPDTPDAPDVVAALQGANTRLREQNAELRAENAELKAQKISGRLRSEKTTRDRYAIRGYASTAAKHGHQIFTAIRDALAGNPWIPPVPGTA